MKYVCKGRVHPERWNIGFDKFELKDDGGHQISAVVSCNASQITVELNVPENCVWEDAHMRAEEIANIAVESAGFSIGSGCSAEILEVIEQNGTSHIVGFIPEGKESGQKLGIDPCLPAFHRALQLSSNNILFRRALQDYLRAITYHNDRPSYCYRAIEAIKSAIEFETGNTGWDAMHSALETDRNSILDTVKQYADPIRHGDWIQARGSTDKQKWDMLLLTRNILVKYMDYAESVPTRSERLRREPLS